MQDLKTQTETRNAKLAGKEIRLVVTGGEGWEGNWGEVVRMHQLPIISKSRDRAHSGAPQKLCSETAGKLLGQ